MKTQELKISKDLVKKWAKKQVSKFKIQNTGFGFDAIQANLKLKEIEKLSEKEYLKIAEINLIRIIKEIEEELIKYYFDKQTNVIFCEWETPKQQVHCNYQKIKDQDIFIRHFSPAKPGDRVSEFWGFRF